MMRIVLIIITFSTLFPAVAGAQSVERHNDLVFYKFAHQEFLICEKGDFQDTAYAALLSAYMRDAVENNLMRRYLRSYDERNRRSNGALDQMVADQKRMTSAEELIVLYKPYEDYLSVDEFFKIHVLQASSITAVMHQKLGPAHVRQLCRTPNQENAL